MIRNPREKEFPLTKEESTSIDDEGASANSSRLWAGLRNPRIVRVSRAFGGKDRHSKVSTVRGLRDRRVRLSVPTAIQLYDLQDRLGVNQPSKVVDWLLTAAQHEIDKLPPLQMPPGNLIHFSQPMLINPNHHQLISPPDSPLNANPPHVQIINQVQNQDEINHSFPILPHTNSYYHWDSTMMGAYNSSQVEGTSANSVIPAASFFQGPNPSMFLPYMNTEFDPRTLQFGMASSAPTQNLGLNSTRAYRLPGGSGVRTFQPNLGSKHHSSEEHDEN